MLYRYCIVDHGGHECRGELEANTREQALRYVGRDDRVVTELTPVGQPLTFAPSTQLRRSRRRRRHVETPVAAPQAEDFRRWLAALGEVLQAEHARALPDAIWQVTGDKPPGRLRRAAHAVLNGLLAGHTLSDVVITLELLTAPECRQLELGEDQGTLPQVLRGLASQPYADRAHLPLSRLPRRPLADQPLDKLLWMLLREAHSENLDEVFIGRSCDGQPVYFGLGDTGTVQLRPPPVNSLGRLHRVLLQHAEIPYWAAYIRYGRFQLDPTVHEWTLRAQPNLIRLLRLSP